MKLDVAEGIEEEITDEVRDGETPASIEPDKTRPAAAVGDIDAAPVGKLYVASSAGNE